MLQIEIMCIISRGYCVKIQAYITNLECTRRICDIWIQENLMSEKNLENVNSLLWMFKFKSRYFLPISVIVITYNVKKP